MPSLIDTFPHLSEGLDTLNAFVREEFQSQLELFGIELYEKQRSCSSPKPPSCAPLSLKEEQQGSKQGLALLKEGKVACLILAGGQGTRLGFHGPKGLLPVTNVFEKTLFRFVFEKIVAASSLSTRPLKVGIMTSSHNYRETIAYLEENHYFGLAKKHVHVFVQSHLPMLNENDEWFLHAPGRLATAPDGNGGALHQLQQSGIADEWIKFGVEYINVLPIDNPLADPFDLDLLGAKSELCIKAITKNSPEESIGVLGEENGRVRVVEYSELPKAKQDWKIGYSGLFCIRIHLLEELSMHISSLPWHIAKKKALCFRNGETREIEVKKFETFIFDLFPQIENPKVILSPRAECFAPIKRAEDLSEVRKALLTYDQKKLSQITGLPKSKKKFELDPAFYYPSPELLSQWQNKSPPDTDYIYP